ncbi:MAG: hypothetical protein Q4D62_13175 [Planctomycetia bacterium]|nr:hypothetical protein [Planctomycetia bacterium]
MKRRILGCLWLVLLTMPAYGEWYRGNLHCHSHWSDGNALPEYVVQFYKENGYHFLCLSDHNIFQSEQLNVREIFGYRFPETDEKAFEGETSTWKPMDGKGWARLTTKQVEQTEKIFGKGSILSKQVGEKTYIRLKTFDELAKQFGEPGRFLMIPGYEQTGGCPDGRQVHMNFVNVREPFAYLKENQTPVEMIRQTEAKGKQLYSNIPEGYLFFVNHPLWRYYDVSPEALKELSHIRFWELNNNGLTFPPHEKGWTPEKFWDVVNAYRATHGQELLLAIGSDDRHGYNGEPLRGCMYVQADSLTIPAILGAIQKGNFYTSQDIELEKVDFDAATKTLHVAVKAEEGVSYRIEFLGTKKGYAEKHEVVDVPAVEKAPARQIDVYSDEIGIVLKSVDGTEASYTLQEDDLYVRARVTIPGKSEIRERSPLLRPGAWTQPVR